MSPQLREHTQKLTEEVVNRMEKQVAGHGWFDDLFK